MAILISKEFVEVDGYGEIKVFHKTIGNYTIEVEAAFWHNDRAFCKPNLNLDIDQYSHVGIAILEDNEYPLARSDLNKIGLSFLEKYIGVWGDTFFIFVPIFDIEKAIHILTINSKNNAIDYSKSPCEKCGLIDSYNSPSAKHNNNIRCYQHCG